MDDETWHHIAATYDMETEQTYVDGEPSAQKMVSDEPDTNNVELTIGFSEGTYLNGMLDEVVILNEAVDQEDIQRMMEGLQELEELSQLIGVGPVEPSDKITATWGSIKAEY